MSNSSLRIPEISQTELNSFRDEHFGQAAVHDFSVNYLPHHTQNGADPSIHPREDEDNYEHYEEQEDDEGLGYYEDGVKRTLTDEQIAIFRHSELEALRRTAEEQFIDSKSTALGTAASSTNRTSEPVSFVKSAVDLPSEDDLPPPETHAAACGSMHKKKKRTRTNKARVESEKPDLRKRTWDVVDAGPDLGSLDYGDGGSQPGPSAASRPTQRRHISYE